MTRLRLAMTLISMACYAGIAQSAPFHSPQTEVLERLAPAMATHDPARLSTAYLAMGDYGLPAADIVEASINASGYRHLENGEFAAAIAVFELNTLAFPDSANAWDSLGEALISSGNQAAAIRYYRKSLDLDPENRNAALMIERLTSEPQLRQVNNLES